LAATFTGFCTCVTAHGVTLWGVDSNHSTGTDRVVRFASSNPAGTIVTIGQTGVDGFIMSGLDFDAGGTLYACSSGISATGSLYTINQTSGQATLVGSLAIPSNRSVTDMTFNPATNRMMGVAFDGERNYLYEISTSSGAASLVGEINSPAAIFLGLCADSSGRMYLEASGGRMYVLDGLDATAMPATIGVNTIFSQGMTMDWSNDGAWYLAATYQHEVGGFNARGDVRLIDRTTGGTQQVLGAWPQIPNDSYPRYAIGDIAVRPVPEAGPAFVTGLALLMSMFRIRGGRGSN
jgi:hypothetical protein